MTLVFEDGLEAVLCLSCQQPKAVYRHGRIRDGLQRYRGTACRRNFQVQHRHKVRAARTRGKIVDMTLNGNGARDTNWMLSISPQTVMRELKKD